MPPSPQAYLVWMAYASFEEKCLSAMCSLKLGSDNLCVIQLFLFSRTTVSWSQSLHHIYATKWKIFLNFSEDIMMPRSFHKENISSV